MTPSAFTNLELAEQEAIRHKLSEGWIFPGL